MIQAGYSAKDGHLLWGPLNHTEVINFQELTWRGMHGDDGIWIETDQSALTATGYNLATGNKLWGPVTLPNANPYSSLGRRYTIGPNGTIMLWTYGGDATQSQPEPETSTGNITHQPAAMNHLMAHGHYGLSR